MRPHTPFPNEGQRPKTRPRGPGIALIGIVGIQNDVLIPTAVILQRRRQMVRKFKNGCSGLFGREKTPYGPNHVECRRLVRRQVRQIRKPDIPFAVAAADILRVPGIVPQLPPDAVDQEIDGTSALFPSACLLPRCGQCRETLLPARKDSASANSAEPVIFSLTRISAGAGRSS